jgi:hypothetical protein
MPSTGSMTSSVVPTILPSTVVLQDLDIDAMDLEKNRATVAAPSCPVMHGPGRTSAARVLAGPHLLPRSGRAGPPRLPRHKHGAN